MFFLRTCFFLRTGRTKTEQNRPERGELVGNLQFPILKCARMMSCWVPQMYYTVSASIVQWPGAPPSPGPPGVPLDPGAPRVCTECSCPCLYTHPYTCTMHLLVHTYIHTYKLPLLVYIHTHTHTITAAFPYGASLFRREATKVRKGSQMCR